MINKGKNMSSTNYSSFWMDNDWDNRRTSIFDEDEIIEKPKVDVVAWLVIVEQYQTLLLL